MNNSLLPTKHRDLMCGVIFLAGLVVAFHLALALHGQGRYRGQHLGTALHYAETQIDLQHTVIVGFNATETPTLQELPVWQAAAGAGFKWFGTAWWGWANVVSLMLFLPCLYPLFQIARQFYGERAAWWTLIFFLSQALVFLYAGEAGTDGFSLAVTLWFWLACVRLIEHPVKWFLPTAGLGALVALSKLPFFMATGLAAFFLLLKMRGLKWREVAALAGVGLLAGMTFLAWTHYTDTLQGGAEFPFVDLRLNGQATDGMTMTFWYFGDWHYRLNPANWVKAGWRFATAVFGSFSLIALLAYALFSRRIHPAAKYFLAGAFLTTLIFSHLVLHHTHYYLMFAPAVALLCAAALAQAETFLQQHGVRSGLITFGATSLILLALFQGLMGMKAFSLDPYPARINEAIRTHTTPADKLAVIYGGWGGDELFSTGRRGLSLWNAKVFEDATSYARLKELGFTKLVILSQSPYQNALQLVNPGQTGIPRELAKSKVTPRVAGWPTVYETEDLIIKAIP